MTGNTTAIGVIGGGVAASTHTYTWKGDGTADGEHAVNDAYGSSKATANTGKATIVVNLDSQAPDNVAANIGGALSSVIDAVKDGNLNNINADGVVGQGAAIGVFGGGVAFGHGSYRSFIGSEDVGAYSVANNEDGADIYLLNGYAAGVFGGGAAGTLNNAKAETNTGVVNMYVGEDMKAVGIFGGGFALSMEGENFGYCYERHGRNISKQQRRAEQYRSRRRCRRHLWRWHGYWQFQSGPRRKCIRCGNPRWHDQYYRE